MLSEFLVQSNKDWILNEYKANQTLSEYGRKQLVAALCAFMRQFFSSRTLTKPQKTMTVSASLELFPSLRSQEESDGGTVCSFLI